ncbi:MAG: phytoene/squalene synthase family protein [Ornithinimicrobium sp.]
MKHRAPTADHAICRTITREHGTTYYWGAAILPREHRYDVYAVYALCRMADDIVDAPGATSGDARTVAQTQQELAAFAEQFRAAMGGERVSEPVIRAAAETARRREIDPECFDRFFTAMTQDLTVTRYATYDDLLGYMDGSAAVIGEMMLPVLRPTDARALPGARDLGLAFQLTNFLRDFAEDRDLGRTYVPTEDLDRFGVERTIDHVTPGWRALMSFEIGRNRALYRSADEGLPYLPPASRRCVQTARHLYCQILDLIEEADYDVFGDRLRVPTWRKAGYATRLMVTPSRVLAGHPS